MQGTRRSRIDLLRLIAMAGVILYHLNDRWSTYGYLGVDLFFVISGYFFMAQTDKKLKLNNFNPVKTVYNKILSFAPVIALASAVSFVLGFMLMVPNDFKRLAESIIASLFFAINILLWITSKGYWDLNNTIKPLMHTWYLGVLVQFFIVAALAFWAVNAIRKNKTKQNNLFVIIAGICASLVFYFGPFFSSKTIFYLLPARAYELLLGCLIFYLPKPKNPSVSKKIYPLMAPLFLLMFCFLFINNSFIIPAWRLFLTVIFAVFFLYIDSIQEKDIKENKIILFAANLGAHTLEIYIWHQIIFAFGKLLINKASNVFVSIALILLSILVSLLTYYGFSKRVSSAIKSKESFRRKRAVIILICFSILLIGANAAVFKNQGVVRDIPELGIDKNHVIKDYDTLYCNRIYDYDNDFSSDKIHVLCIGNSYARDFANVLLESSLSDKIEISYIEFVFDFDMTDAKNQKRVKDADYVFYAHDEEPYFIPQLGSDDYKLYIVGNKRFGISNSMIYARRHLSNYPQSTVKIDAQWIEQNKLLSEQFGDRFIDLMGPLLQGDSIRVFTDDCKFISFDGKHFSQFGAQYYAGLLDDRLTTIIQLQSF